MLKYLAFQVKKSEALSQAVLLKPFYGPPGREAHLKSDSHLRKNAIITNAFEKTVSPLNFAAIWKRSLSLQSALKKCQAFQFCQPF